MILNILLCIVFRFTNSFKKILELDHKTSILAELLIFDIINRELLINTD